MHEDPALVYEATENARQELRRWMPWYTPDYSLDHTRQFIELQAGTWQRGDEFAVSILDARSGKFLGATGINCIDHVNRRANLGYWLRTDQTGRGIATEAVKLLAPAALADLDLERLEIVAAVDNLASRRVAERAGATFEGIARGRVRAGGRQSDAAVYSLVRADFALPKRES